ncbi:hypothetical protein DPMN_117938 [Dreissena polymorpha]|uniref:Uncharacterized protein n=1 Tax=Dreissena polymorpha TaxID=45954 RepID=A0A9D4GM78_DREPO|nr:hypothetical protein DPMN_117938 [Dreissena polymorpha]
MSAGSATTGGGAGGRISVTYTTSSEFTGSWTTYGGKSTHSYGGAGTVYVVAVTKKFLYVDNKEPYPVPVIM